MFAEWHDRFQFLVSADGRTVEVFEPRATQQESLFAYLLSQVLSIALLQQKVEGLHAAAFTFGKHTFALIGDCGFGKSTLAAHCIAGGARLLTDDLLICNDHLEIMPGAARIKLDPLIAARTLGTRAGIPMLDARGKHIYALEPHEFEPQPQALDCVFVIDPEASAVECARMSHADAFKALIAATFNPLEQDRARLASHMQYHARLARAVPVFRLGVPRVLDRIAEVVTLVNHHRRDM